MVHNSEQVYINTKLLVVVTSLKEDPCRKINMIKRRSSELSGRTLSRFNIRQGIDIDSHCTVGRRDDVANFKLEMFKLPVEKKT